MSSLELQNKRRGRIFAYAPLVVWVGVILILGSGPGSSAETSRFLKPLIQFFFPDAAPDTFLLIHAFIRKSAHFVEYAILALLSAFAFRGTANRLTRRNWAVVALLLVGAVAAADEWNQSFYSSRTGSPWDVMLDIAGGAFALIVFWLVHRRDFNRASDARPV